MQCVLFGGKEKVFIDHCLGGSTGRNVKYNIFHILVCAVWTLHPLCFLVSTAVMDSSDLIFLGLPSGNGFGFVPSWLAHLEAPLHPHFTWTFSVWGCCSCCDKRPQSERRETTGLESLTGLEARSMMSKCGQGCLLPGALGVPSRPPDPGEGWRSSRLVAASLPSLPVLTSPSPLSTL